MGRRASISTVHVVEAAGVRSFPGFVYSLRAIHLTQVDPTRCGPREGRVGGATIAA